MSRISLFILNLFILFFYCREWEHSHALVVEERGRFAKKRRRRYLLSQTQGESICILGKNNHSTLYSPLISNMKPKFTNQCYSPAVKSFLSLCVFS